MGGRKREVIMTLDNLRDRIGQIGRELDALKFSLDRLETPPQTMKEIEAAHSDIMKLLHPHQREDESLYETAERLIPKKESEAGDE